MSCVATDWQVGVCEWKSLFSASVGMGSMLELQHVKFFFFFFLKKKDDRILRVHALSYRRCKKIVCRRGSSRNKKNQQI